MRSLWGRWYTKVTQSTPPPFEQHYIDIVEEADIAHDCTVENVHRSQPPSPIEEAESGFITYDDGALSLHEVPDTGLVVLLEGSIYLTSNHT